MEQPNRRYMTREGFRRWLEEQAGGTRYERVAGEPIAMAPERIIHARLKARVWQALDRALSGQDAGCEALPDGITVEVDDDTDYEPDAVVNCGPRLPDDAVAASNPVIVVEVPSPGPSGVDTGGKLADYFRVPSIRHYLIVHTNRKAVIHHQRAADGSILTRIVSSGRIDLEPPGISIGLEEVYGD